MKWIIPAVLIFLIVSSCDNRSGGGRYDAWTDDFEDITTTSENGTVIGDPDTRDWRLGFGSLDEDRFTRVTDFSATPSGTVYSSIAERDSVVIIGFSVYNNHYDFTFTWGTSAEEHVGGFNIYRGSNADDYAQGSTVMLNQQTLPADGNSTEDIFYSCDIHDEIPFFTQYYYWLETLFFNGGSLVTDPVTFTPAGHEFYPAFPNPAGNHLNFRFRLIEASHVSIRFIDEDGYEVGSIVDMDFPAGTSEYLKYTGAMERPRFLRCLYEIETSGTTYVGYGDVYLED